MTFAPSPWEEYNQPICKKHGYRGYNCMQCYHEQSVVIEREKFLNIMHVLHTMLKSAGLTTGANVAKSIIEKETLKK